MYMLNALTFKYWRLINALVGQTKQFASEAAILQPWAKGTEVSQCPRKVRVLQLVGTAELSILLLQPVSNGAAGQGWVTKNKR